MKVTEETSLRFTERGKNMDFATHCNVVAYARNLSHLQFVSSPTMFHAGAVDELVKFGNILLESVRPELPETVALKAVQAVLDRREWRPENLDEIAGLLRAAGFPVREYEPVAGPDPRD